MNKLVFSVISLLIFAFIDVVLYFSVDSITTSIAINYVFINVSFIVFFVTFLVLPSGKESLPINASTGIILTLYVLISLILGVVFTHLKYDGIWAIIIQAGVLLLFIVILSYDFSTGKKIRQQSNVMNENIHSMDNIKSKLKYAIFLSADVDEGLTSNLKDVLNVVNSLPYSGIFQEIEFDLTNSIEYIIRCINEKNIENAKQGVKKLDNMIRAHMLIKEY